MTTVRVLLHENEVNDYLAENGLEEGNVPLETVCLQAGGTIGGKPAVLLIATIDGQKRVIKTTFNLFDMIRGGLLGAIQRLAQREHGN
jgi:hypothetical protein